MRWRLKTKDLTPGSPTGGRAEVDANGAGNGELAQAAVARRKTAIPDPEVSARPKRRRFSAAYKARVAEDAVGLEEKGVFAEFFSSINPI